MQENEYGTRRWEDGKNKGCVVVVTQKLWMRMKQKSGSEEFYVIRILKWKLMQGKVSKKLNSMRCAVFNILKSKNIKTKYCDYIYICFYVKKIEATTFFKENVLS